MEKAAGKGLMWNIHLQKIYSYAENIIKTKNWNGSSRRKAKFP